ncbi:cyclic nucleotide-binding domain-containing protein, partial [Acinetobacter baumannii]|uniref:cyclic nucleotide-binding domain-containing protein n=1 Tax=Acinetobacter baumannii TaxID=470 RepID=UPI0039F11332
QLPSRYDPFILVSGWNGALSYSRQIRLVCCPSTAGPMDRSALFHPQADAASYRERLHASSWFGTLDAPLQDALIGIAAVRRLSAGDVLFRRGDPPDGLYCVV